MKSVVEEQKEYSLFSVIKRVKYDFQHNKTNVVPPLPEKYISASQIIIKIWQKQLENVDMKILKYSPEWDIHRKVMDVFKINEKEVANAASQLNITDICEDDLRSIIESIGIKIANYILFNFEFFKFEIFDKLIYFLDNICWTDQFTINYLKISVQIMDQLEDMSITERCQLACHHCFEDKIRELNDSLPLSKINELENDELSLCSFWIRYINTRVITEIESKPILTVLLQKISCDNALPVKWIWEKFADASTIECVMEYAEEAIDLNAYNVLLFLAKQMTREQLEMASPTIHCKLLYKLHDISRWNKSLRISNLILELIKTKDAFHNFEVIAFCWIKNLLTGEEFVNIWNEFKNSFKSDFKSNPLKIYNGIFRFGYISNKQKYIILIFLENVTAANKIQLIYSDNTLNFCEYLITCYGIQDYKIFLKDFLKEEEILHYNKIFFEEKCLSLCTSLIMDDKYDTLENLLIEFCQEERINVFKYKLAYQADAYILTRISLNIINDETDLISVLNKFLSWCFNEDEKEIMNFKTTIFDIESESYTDLRNTFFNEIIQLKNQNKRKLVEKYWQWFFYASHKNLTSSKEKLERIKNILLLVSQNLDESPNEKQFDYHYELMRFIISHFNKDEIEELKEELQRNIDHLAIFVQVIMLNQLSDADDFLDWCFSSDKNKIDDFKVVLMESHLCEIMFELINCTIFENSSFFNTEEIKTLLKWFNPSDKSFKIFVESFKKCVEFNRETYFAVHLGGEMKDEIYWIMWNQKVDRTLEFLAFYRKEAEQ